MQKQKWGGLAAFLLPLVYMAASWVYLVGNLRSAIGPFAYSLADFLFGPVWAASLIAAVSVLRERIGDRAERRMSLALLAAGLSAGAMVLVAFIRSANRQYHLHHPELHLETSSPVLTVWTTIVAGITGAGWHFLGWALLLIGWSGWTSGRLPRALCILYVVVGLSSLFVYLVPPLEGTSVTFLLVLGVWQGVLLWRGQRGAE